MHMTKTFGLKITLKYVALEDSQENVDDEHEETSESASTGEEKERKMLQSHHEFKN